MNSNSNFKFDEIDRKIITLLEEDPNLTHNEIARRINKSQPTIGIRLRKLLKKGVFHIQPGINLKDVDIYMAHVRLKAEDPRIILDVAKFCPYTVNCFLVSGDYNISLFLVSSRLEYIDSMVNDHYRTQEDIRKVKLDLVTDIAEDFIVPLKLEEQTYHNPMDKDNCITKCPFCHPDPLI